MLTLIMVAVASLVSFFWLGRYSLKEGGRMAPSHSSSPAPTRKAKLRDRKTTEDRLLASKRVGLA
jgi:hypothetical protein